MSELQELFDAIVVNPYDDDAVADAIADTRHGLGYIITQKGCGWLSIWTLPVVLRLPWYYRDHFENYSCFPRLPSLAG